TLSSATGDVTEGAAGAAGYKDITITLSRALTSGETVLSGFNVSGVTPATDYTLALQPASQTGVELRTTETPGAYFLNLTNGATGATLRFTPLDNRKRSQPAVSIGFPTTGVFIPTGYGGATVGTVSGSPLTFSVIDDETGAVRVPSNWPLIPSGLNAGDKFRLLFVTGGTRTAESTDIEVYNDFVQGQVAASGHRDLQPYGGLVKVLGSTSAVNARANTGTTGAGSNIPIYWVSGAKAADDYTDFYDGSWDGTRSSDYRKQDGATGGVSASISTGTADDGTTSGPLGGSQVSYTSVGNTATFRQAVAAKDNQYHFFAVSPEFTVSGPLVEFAQAEQSVVEDAGTVNVQVDFIPAPRSALTLSYTLSGTAAHGTDYTITGATGNGGTVSVASGISSVTIPVAVRADTDDESAETVILTLTAPTGYELGLPSVHTLTITDDDFTVPSIWPLKPTGLAPGDKYRLLYRSTNLRDAEAADLATYDAWVQGEIHSANPLWTALEDYKDHFKAVGSSATVDARDHLGMRVGSSWNPGVAIYWLDDAGEGALVADDYEDFCDREMDQEDADNQPQIWWKNDLLADQRNQEGAPHTNNNWPWTGTDNDCTKSAGQYLGAAPSVAIGKARDQNRSAGPLNDGAQARDSANSLYTISPVFIVGPPIVTLTPTSLDVPADGGMATYTVQLKSAPTGNVTVALASSDTSHAAVSPSSLTFTPSGATAWNVAQTVTVSSTSGAIVDDEATITHTIQSSGDPTNFPNGVVLGAELAVTLTAPGDGVTVSPATLTLTELGGASAQKTYTVVLDSDPGAMVTITVASQDTSAVAVDTDAGTDGDQSTLTFTHGSAGNWGTPQTVTVRALNDADAVGEQDVEITHKATATSGAYDEIDIDAVEVDVTDAGHGLTLTTTTLDVYANEGAATYTVQLKSAPSGNVTVAVASGDTTHATVDTDTSTDGNQLTLTFAPSGANAWNVAQTVTVTSASGAAVNDTATITHTIQNSGDTTNYPNGVVSGATVTATVVTDTRPVVTVVAETNLGVATTQVAEGQTLHNAQVPAPFVLRHTGPPGQYVQVRHRRATEGDYARTPNLLGDVQEWISPGAGSDASISISDDNVDEPNGKAIVTVLPRPTHYRIGSPGRAEVVVLDNDPTTVTLARAAGAAVTEGAEHTYTITLGRGLVNGETLAVPLTFNSGTGAAVRNS
ncbi:MAG: hypothetical protein OXG27_15145, partial [Chloroflexi bacterium]|nr:hypothetical protein [Chloroflexota bacterium]